MVHLKITTPIGTYRTESTDSSKEEMKDTWVEMMIFLHRNELQYFSFEDDVKRRIIIPSGTLKNSVFEVIEE